MASIQGIYAREILDSRGVPTIEATLWLDNGGIVATSVPTGTSVGKYEAHELRDKDANRMLGKGVLKAVEHINTVIAPALIGKDPLQQEEIDQLLVQMDGTLDRSKLGSNTLIAVSQAVLKAGALVQNVPLYYYILRKYQLAYDLHIPSCIFTMISGGEHGAGNLDIQEFQIVPASHFDFAATLNMGVTIFQKLEEVLVLKGAIHSVGLSGGFTPNLYSNTDVFEILVETIKTSPYTFAQDLFFGMDVAAEQIFENGRYKLKDRSQPYDAKELSEYYKKLRSLYHVFCIEDPFQEDDTEAWKLLTAELGETTRIIGDSFLVTNKEKTQKAIDQKLCNTLLVKPNQVGTITETIEVIRLARTAGWQIIMSHRSGETNDDLIVDLAVGVGADYVRFGPPNRGERIAKYNRLLQINQEILYSQQQQAQASAATSTSAAPASTVAGVKTPVAPEATTPTSGATAPAETPIVPAPEPITPTAVPSTTPTAEPATASIESPTSPQIAVPASVEPASLTPSPVDTSSLPKEPQTAPQAKPSAVTPVTPTSTMTTTPMSTAQVATSPTATTPISAPPAVTPASTPTPAVAPKPTLEPITTTMPATANATAPTSQSTKPATTTTPNSPPESPASTPESTDAPTDDLIESITLPTE